jgi:hypothetical protein
MKHASRRKGLALPFVLICVSMILGTWGLANRQTVAVVQLKQRIVQREQGNLAMRGRRLALAYGLALLQSGNPDVPNGQSSYVCQALIEFPDGSNQTYVLTFTQTQVGVWSLVVRARVSTDDPNLPRPSSFPPATG